MKEHQKITFARELCRKYNLKYRIKNDALFILCNRDNTNKYIQVCYNLLNLDEGCIKGIISPLQYKAINGCVHF